MSKPYKKNYRKDDSRDRYRNRPPRSRKPLTATGGDPNSLPAWVRDEVTRTTPKERRIRALGLLAAGVDSFASGRFDAASRSLREAKDLSPRAATIREILGLAEYESSRWKPSLQELRAFRRMTGDTSHMAVEIDCLRALDRTSDVPAAYEQFRELGGSKEAENEVRVVYASFLLDEGRLNDAWSVIKPGRLVENPHPDLLRRWYVAARVAATGGDEATARKLQKAVRDNDSDFPGLDQLESLIDAI